MKAMAITGIAAMWLMGSAFPATGTVIVDDFVGAAHNGATNTSDFYNPTSTANYNITQMDVTYTGTSLSTKIYSDYFGAWVSGNSATELGDLFISSNGWNPYGTSPHGEDGLGQGEDWEWVIDLNGITVQASNGTTSLFRTASSEGVIVPGSVRDAQEWHWLSFNPSLSEATGSWQILSDADGYYLMILSALPEDFASITTLGLHYTMECGNDVIEGAVSSSTPVPEPSTMILFATGLAGLAGFGRTRRKS